MRVSALIVLCTATLMAADKPDLTPAQAEETIQKFASQETQFAKARESYTYTQTARVQELDDSGTVRGRWEEVADIVFDKDFKRTEHVVRAPVSTLKELLMTPEDLADLRDVQPFVLTTNELPKYQVRYLGREKLDEIDCYAFAVKPKKLEPGQRYFEGIVWVDDQDIQVVKTYGRGVGVVKKDNMFPKFETYREQIDGKYWFPTYTIANSTLHFSDHDQRMRQTVKYEKYLRFRAETSITFGDEVQDSKPAPPDGKSPETPAKKP